MMKTDYDKSAPLALNTILVSRADNSPENGDRPRGKGYIVDKNGVPVPDPAKEPEKIALEANPNLLFEHFDEFWRKVHRPRVVYQDGADDGMLKNAAAYYQIHRLPAAPSSTFPPPYPAIVDEKGFLYPVEDIHVPAYQRPVYDGMVYWGAPTIDDLLPIGYSPKAEKKINAEGQVFLRNAVSGLSAEYIIIPLQGQKLPPFCTVKVHYRASGTREDFRNYLLREHSRMICSRTETKEYVKRFAYIFCENKDLLEPFASGAGMKIDALSVMYFDNISDCEQYFASAGYQEIAASERQLLDVKRSEWWTGVVYPFFYPTEEQVTDINKKIQ